MIKSFRHLEVHMGRIRCSAALLSVLLVAAACFWNAAAQDYNRTKNPHGPLKDACESCHTTVSWKPPRPFPDFNHKNTRYALQGLHKKVGCMQCHVKLVFSNVGSQCADCHADIHRRQLGSACDQCHTVQGWRTVAQNVNGHLNRFPLMGAHSALECEACHRSAAVGLFRGLRTDCVSCHLNDFNNAKSIDHKAAGFSTQCETCHGMDSWNASFNHAQATGFALLGAHAQLNCLQCHVGGRFKGTPADCAGCHLQDYNTATRPNHVQAGFPKDCSLCHSVSSWLTATFDHNSTKFPLTGFHATLQCQDCHSSGQYATLPTTCVSCHLALFNSSTNPNHVAAGFSQDCSICHNTTAWTPAIFDHSTTKFPLTGAHAGLQCSSCHSSGQYATLPTTCVSCHLALFNSTTNPNHVTAGFPQDCSVCHSTAAWTPATFDHSKTKFPLTGAHATLQCPSCHSSGQYATLPTTCVSCHLANFNSATNPNHVTSGFPQDCTICHSTTAWTPATFDHSKTAFPLTGAHTTVQCTSCHINGVYAGTPTDCYSCHSKEYNSTTDPAHAAAGFPHDCSQCHSTSTWSGAVFNHTWFPIYSGSHAGKWTVCGDCHTNSNDYAVFSCVNCHAHDQASTDQAHRGIANYVYNSANCYSCHPTGRSD